jgi:hypothetical protein
MFQTSPGFFMGGAQASVPRFYFDFCLFNVWTHPAPLPGALRLLLHSWTHDFVVGYIPAPLPRLRAAFDTAG